MTTTTKTDGIGFLVTEIGRLMRRVYEQHNQGNAITLAQARLLLHVSRFEGVRQIDLAELLEVQPMTLAKLLDQLESQGLVIRQPAPKDRRAHSIYLTEAATPVLQSIEHVAALVRAEALAGLSEEDIATASRVLLRMRNNLSQR